MISGIDLSATVDYQLKSDKENPTTWKLGILPSYLMAKLSLQAREDEIEFAYKLLQFTIKGWENFDVPFSTKKEKVGGREFDIVPLEILERLPFTAISELSGKVVEINKLTEDERKN